MRRRLSVLISPHPIATVIDQDNGRIHVSSATLWGPRKGRRLRRERGWRHVVPDMWLAQNANQRDWRFKGL